MNRNVILPILLVMSLLEGGLALAELPDFLEPFPRSRQIQQIAIDAQEYRVMLGGVVKINRLIRTDRELRLSGKLERTTWQLPVGHSPEDGFRYLRGQLQDAGAEMLFECSGRQCGASNIWANDLFDTSRLYGVDESQFYLAARRGVNYLVVYAVRRGNGRVFLHLDWLVDASSDDQGWAQVLEQQGYAELPDWPESPDNAIRAMAALLEERPEKHLVLVLHQAGRDIELSLRQSRELALRLRDQVLAEGIAPNRIDAHGAGALSPSVLGGRRQVAVVILTDQE
ncbi:hypothetical protein GCM10011352_15390 [Marinobacterium zhoushanense]|uniref:DUF4892 domain-containing protein n=1 Tax=Marinobacterium zhoushanense TaxID=1679163 RepID=A0ABQ1K6X7_9GAMM|nr:DUF4892 domain-containing protein [Marinobacterium zhoushanense]GGB90295.1 hypothetical protein GCM10011352_15390 [Marinobacterium zhoushanense]